jgi:hypothetical protein
LSIATPFSERPFLRTPQAMLKASRDGPIAAL